MTEPVFSFCSKGLSGPMGERAEEGSVTETREGKEEGCLVGITEREKKNKRVFKHVIGRTPKPGNKR